MQLKQWDPVSFIQLQKQYSNKIEEIIQTSTKKLFQREAVILEALQYPLEELKKAIVDEEIRKKIEDRYPCLKTFIYPFSEEDKLLVTPPFPLMICSTKTKSSFLNNLDESHIYSVKWGEEADLIFVQKDHLPVMADWLKKQELSHKIGLHCIETISSLFTLPLSHASGDVIGGNIVLSHKDYKFIHQHIQNIVPLYQKTYPDGTSWEHHGVVHAARTALFSAIITELYLAQGYLFATQPKYLPIIGFIHDAGRESDFEEDLWDEQSGKICENYMHKELKVNSEEALSLSRSISEKDKDPSISLEQKVTHDADCIEIIRCYLSDPNTFECERLWLFKDRFPKPLIETLITEAKSLIALTESHTIKKFLQGSSDPLRCLMQIINFTKGFPFLRANVLTLLHELCDPSEYLLTPEIEQAILPKN